MGTIYLRNTLVAGNLAQSSTNVDVYRSSGTVTSNGYNIFGEYTLAHLATSTADWSDQDDNGTYILSGGGSGTLSLASATADDTYGTYTHALQTGSVGIDHGTASAHSAGGSTISVPTNDQRVLDRSGTTDIGSYEWRTSDSTIPTVSLSLPSEGATIYGSAIGIAATASDDTEVAGVQFYVNNIAIGSEDTSSPYAITWNSLTATTSGTKIVFAVARDTANNYATSSSRTVTLSNHPSPSSLSYTAATTTATVTWNTPVEGSSRMYFGFTNALASSTPEQNTSSRVTSHSMNLSGLPGCAVFKYQTVSKNEADEIATSTESTLKTSGCTAGAAILANNEDDITAASGGTLTQGVLSLTVPASFTSSSSAATFQAKRLDGSTFYSSVSAPTGKTRANTNVYNLSAYTDTSTSLSTFAQPLTVTLSYSDSDISDLDESSLKIHRYDGATWSELSSCTANTSSNTVSCTTTQFSDFSIFGDASSGSETTTSPPSSSTSITSRVRNLINMGNITLANSLMNQYPSQFENQNPIQVAVPNEVGLTNNTKFIFNKTLRPQETGPDILELQKFLNANGFTINASGPGSKGYETSYFGTLTQNALKKFQEANRTSILDPIGLTSATGILGPSTRSFINTR